MYHSFSRLLLVGETQFPPLHDRYHHLLLRVLPWRPLEVLHWVSPSAHFHFDFDEYRRAAVVVVAPHAVLEELRVSTLERLKRKRNPPDRIHPERQQQEDFEREKAETDFFPAGENAEGEGGEGGEGDENAKLVASTGAGFDGQYGEQKEEDGGNEERNEGIEQVYEEQQGSW